MSKKIDYLELFVACPVYDHSVVEEPWEQYETFGRVNHHVLVSPKRVLVYSQLDEEGNVRYYKYPSGEEVVDSTYLSSFMSTSSPSMNLYYGYMHVFFPLPIKGLRDEAKDFYHSKRSEVGYFIPVEDYVASKLGKNIPVTSIGMASKLIRVLNVTNGRTFELSHDDEVAKEQLEKIGYSVSKHIKKK